MRSAYLVAAGAALATSALASPALALDHAWYVGVEGGAMIVEDTHFDYNRTFKGLNTKTANGVIINHRTGIDADLIGGYDFGMLRAEAEIGYKRAGIGGVSVANTITRLPLTSFNGDGHSSAISSMGNLLLDFGDEHGLSGYVGGGVGVARVRYDLSVPALAGGSPNLVDRDSRLAYQAIAGVRYAISPNVDLGLKYRFFDVRKLHYNDAIGGDYRARFRSYSLLASLIFNFAPPPPPPPPPPLPPAPPPPTPPAAQTCADGSVIAIDATCRAPAPVSVGPFIIFFDWDKSEITSNSAAILDNAAAAYQRTGKASVILAGHADRSGSSGHNMSLSQRRSDAVKTYLAGKGIADSVVTTHAFGETRPLIETADGVREPQNRRVEIRFGQGSGQ